MPDDKGKYDIIVNATPEVVDQDEVTFEQVVTFAFPTPPSGQDIHYVVTYYNGGGRPPEGELTKGQTAKVKDGTVFSATYHDRS